MKKWSKRALVGLAVVLGVIVLFCSIGLILFRSEPEWYKLPQLSEAEREAAAQRATNKLAMIQNEVARLRAMELGNTGRASATSPVTAPARNPITVSFTDDELNAFFDKWIAWNNWRAAYQRHMTDPVLILDDGRLILAGRLREMDAIVSLHFEPEIDEQGKLHLHLERVLGGNLPLPAAVFGNYRQKLTGSMQMRLPQWRRAAALDRGGTPNSSAIAATMGALLINVLHDRPAEPILFLPLVDQGAVAVKLTDVQIEDHTLTLTVEPLTGSERADLLARIKNGAPMVDASSR